MENIANVSVEPLNTSKYLKPLRIKFTQDGRQQFWDLAQFHDSVSCLLFNTTRRVLILVKQFRPDVFFNAGLRLSSAENVESINWARIPVHCGITVELCGGIIDIDIPTKEVIQKEVKEECGYDVPIECFTEIIRRHNIGTIFYAECTDEMRIGTGGGLETEGEMIEVVELETEGAKKMIFQPHIDDSVDASLLLALMWFVTTKL